MMMMACLVGTSSHCVQMSSEQHNECFASAAWNQSLFSLIRARLRQNPTMRETRYLQRIQPAK
jgi:nucleoside-specific outer membrane channel protein Tsx